MGILTNNINETGVQILEWQAQVYDFRNRIAFIMTQLDNQLQAMKSNNEFTQEDILEMEELIKQLKGGE